jgi:hypothetical protein
MNRTWMDMAAKSGCHPLWRLAMTRIALAVMSGLLLAAASGCSGESGKCAGVIPLPEGTWELLVRDANGRPINGATIQPEYDGKIRPSDFSFDEFKAGSSPVQSDSAGRVQLTRSLTTSMPPEERSIWRIRISATHHASKSLPVRDVLESTKPLVVILEKEYGSGDGG